MNSIKMLEEPESTLRKNIRNSCDILLKILNNVPISDEDKALRNELAEAYPQQMDKSHSFWYTVVICKEKTESNKIKKIQEKAKCLLEKGKTAIVIINDDKNSLYHIVNTIFVSPTEKENIWNKINVVKNKIDNKDIDDQLLQSEFIKMYKEINAIFEKRFDLIYFSNISKEKCSISEQLIDIENNIEGIQGKKNKDFLKQHLRCLQKELEEMNKLEARLQKEGNKDDLRVISEKQTDLNNKIFTLNAQIKNSCMYERQLFDFQTGLDGIYAKAEEITTYFSQFKSCNIPVLLDRACKKKRIWERVLIISTNLKILCDNYTVDKLNSESEIINNEITLKIRMSGDVKLDKATREIREIKKFFDNQFRIETINGKRIPKGELFDIVNANYYYTTKRIIHSEEELQRYIKWNKKIADRCELLGKSAIAVATICIGGSIGVVGVNAIRCGVTKITTSLIAKHPRLMKYVAYVFDISTGTYKLYNFTRGIFNYGKAQYMNDPILANEAFNELRTAILIPVGFGDKFRWINLFLRGTSMATIPILLHKDFLTDQLPASTTTDITGIVLNARSARIYMNWISKKVGDGKISANTRLNLVLTAGFCIITALSLISNIENEKIASELAQLKNGQESNIIIPHKIR